MDNKDKAYYSWDFYTLNLIHCFLAELQYSNISKY